jgi:uncharacterized protein YndB with AHSA1/START domain
LISVTRTVDLPAPPASVWPFLTESGDWSRWWGAGSIIDAVPGGRMLIVYPNGQTAVGEVVAVDPPHRITFTYGYDRPDPPIPPGGSSVTIELVPIAGGTRLTLRHDVDDKAVADQHAPGWRYQLGLFRSLVAHERHAAGLPDRIDRWHEAWTITDPEARRSALATVVTDDVRVAEPTALLDGLEDLHGFIAQSQQHLPGSVQRTGPPLLSGDQAVWPWRLEVRDVVVVGVSVARLAVDGRFTTVTGFWGETPPGVPTSRVEDAGRSR